MAKAIDKFLVRFTLCRLTLYYLASLLFFALILSIFNLIAPSFKDILLSTLLVFTVGIISNYIFARIFGARTSLESVSITLFILILIIPIKFPADLIFVLLATLLAIASKYLLTILKRHVFNPVAISAVGIILLYPEKGITWWVGTPATLPLVILGGLLVVRKMKRQNDVLTFLVAYLIMVAFGTFLNSSSWSKVVIAWQSGLLHSALLFFAFAMLTEPQTMPMKKRSRFFYAILIAILYSTPQLRILGIRFAPEAALCLGNIFSHISRSYQTSPSPHYNNRATG